MDENFENWNEIPSLPDMDAELKKIRKELRKRNLRIVATCLLLGAALLIGAIKLAIPAWEKQYFDPNKQTLSKYNSDLTITMAAYAELFSPSQTISNVYATRTGFASYSLSVQQWHTRDHGDLSYQIASIHKGDLVFPQGFWEMCSANIFERACYPVFSLGDEANQRISNDLSQLPDYIHLQAAVSFTEDLNMEQIIALSESLEDGYLEWVAIRTCDMDEQMYPLCGMKPTASGVVWDSVNEYYPCFDIKAEEETGELFEKHFLSLLQFSIDQLETGRGIETTNYRDTSYYQRALDYVEENGVCSYGAYIVAPASELLALMDSGVASQIWPQDAWIDF